MKIIRPVTIGDSNLTSSSVPETDYSVWAAGPTSYAQGAHVIRGHRRWESLVPSNVGNDPLTSPTKWVDMGPTNRYAMFDNSVGTVTTAADEIAVVIAPGSVDAIALLDVTAELVEVKMTVGGDIVYQKTVSTYGTGQAITNLYLYFTARIGRRSVLLFMDMPKYSNGIITVTATAADGESVSIGTMAVGNSLDIGSTEIGAKAGINDFSKKQTDDYGNTTVAERNYAKRNSVRLLVPADSVDTVFSALAALRAVPIVWIASTRFDCFVTFGFFKSFEIDIAYYNAAYCSLETEGLA